MTASNGVVYLDKIRFSEEKSVILFMGKTAMGEKSYLPRGSEIDLDRNLFPDE